MKGNGRKFVLGVAAISSGTAVGQMVLIISAPLLARFYSPEDFAVLTVVTSCAIPLAMFLTLRFESAVPLAGNDDVARGLAQIAILVGLTFSVVVSVTVLFISRAFPSALESVSLGAWAYAVPVLAFLIAIYRVALQWAIRRQAYKSIGYRNVAQSVATVIAQVGGGARSFGPYGLVGGYVIGQTIGVCLLLWGAQLFRRLNLSVFRSAVTRYWRLALTLAPAGIINSLGVYLPAILITALYGPIAGGSYGLAQRVLAGPVTLLGQSISQVYLAEVSSNLRRESNEIKSLFYRVSLMLAIAAVSLALIVGIGSPWIFAVAFGEEWQQAGVISRILAIQLGAQLIASPLSNTLIAFERAGTQLVWDIARLTLVVASFAFSWAAGLDLVSALVIFTLTSTGMYALSWDLSRRTVNMSTRTGGEQKGDN